MRPSLRFFVLFCSLALIAAASGSAQDSLRSLEVEYAKRQAAAAEQTADFAAFTEVTKWYEKALSEYLRSKPAAADRVPASLVLVQLRLALGDGEAAAAALRSFDAEHAGLLELLTAAELAGHAGLDEQRATWVDSALERRDAPFRDRMEAGMVLMTRLALPDRADAWFARELERAENDEQRAEVGWYIAYAVREREDRGDGDYERSLEQLAQRYPKTEFGKIAHDRLRAMAYEVGAEAVALRGVDLAGKPLALADYRGKVTLVYFWASWNRTCQADLVELRRLLSDYADREFAILGVCLDTDRAALDAFLAEHPHSWRDLYDGRGLESPHALRSNVDQVPSITLVDREGKVAALRLALWDSEAIAHVRQRIERALGGEAGAAGR